MLTTLHKALLLLSLFTLSLIVTSSIAYAQEYRDISLTILDNNGGALDDSLVKLEISGSNQSSVIDKYTQTGTFTIRLLEGDYDVQIHARKGSSAYYNYLGQEHINTDNPFYNITMVPVSYLRITVVDLSNTLVPNATLKIDCISGTQTFQTDSFGTYSTSYLLTGDCRIYAEKDGVRGLADANITSSDVYDIKVVLNNSRMNYSLLIIAIVVAVVIVGFILGFHITRRRKSSDRKAGNRIQKRIQKNPGSTVQRKPDGPAKISTAETAKKADAIAYSAIMKTLDDNERKVVEFLINNDGASQSKIRYATLIPKTSMFRIISRLERKNLVRTEEFGKLKKVYLKDISELRNEKKE